MGRGNAGDETLAMVTHNPTFGSYIAALIDDQVPNMRYQYLRGCRYISLKVYQRGLRVSTIASICVYKQVVLTLLLYCLSSDQT